MSVCANGGIMFSRPSVRPSVRASVRSGRRAITYRTIILAYHALVNRCTVERCRTSSNPGDLDLIFKGQIQIFRSNLGQFFFLHFSTFPAIWSHL